MHISDICPAFHEASQVNILAVYAKACCMGRAPRRRYASSFRQTIHTLNKAKCEGIFAYQSSLYKCFSTGFNNPYILAVIIQNITIRKELASQYIHDLHFQHHLFLWAGSSFIVVYCSSRFCAICIGPTRIHRDRVTILRLSVHLK